VRGRYVTQGFFDLFGAPFAAGRGWDARDDASASRVVVLNAELARRLFGDTDAVGRTVRIGEQPFVVTGVLESWHPRPLFYGSAKGEFAFKSEDGFFLPLSAALEANTGIAASMTCWESGAQGYQGDGCAWLQYWVRLRNAAERQAYADYLQAWWSEQRKGGRDMAARPPELLSLRERLHRLKLVPADVSLQLWLTLGLLAICVVNAVSLLMAKTLRRQSEISIRRAVGATRLHIIGQIGAEALGVGLASALVGIASAQLLVLAVRRLHVEYASLVSLDSSLLLWAVITAVVAALAASIVPAVQAARVRPAHILKAL
jgi:putative ABC transport system permease protein